MFLQGIIMTLATGLIWCGIAIVYSRAAQKKRGFYLFLFLSAFFFFLISWGGSMPAPAKGWVVAKIAAIMIPAAVASQLGFLALGWAMRRGSHGVSWSIAQSSMLCPFAAGMILFGEDISFFRSAGMILLLASLAPLGRSQCGANSKREGRSFLIPAFLAFGLIGLQQTLTLLPNRIPGVDPAALSWRIPLFSLCGLGWIVAVIRYKEFREYGVIGLAILNGILSTVGQWTFYRALDWFVECEAAGIAYPLAVGSSVALFFLYTELIRKERTGFAGILGVILAIIGMVFLAF